MGNISRVLAVVTAALSVAFLGFAVANRLGGPNWESTARSLNPQLNKAGGYVFSQSVGENPQWSANSAAGDSIKTSAVLPEVIVAALDHKIAGLKAELDALINEQPQLETRKTNLEAAIDTDEQALRTAVAQRRQFLTQLREQYATLSRQLVQKAEAGRQTEDVVAARRNDVFRLLNQLEVLKADIVRLGQIEQQMVDSNRQIDADLDKAQRRQQQLKSRLDLQ